MCVSYIAYNYLYKYMFTDNRMMCIYMVYWKFFIYWLRGPPNFDRNHTLPTDLIHQTEFSLPCTNQSVKIVNYDRKIWFRSTIEKEL